jgi:hypothetical protein
MNLPSLICIAAASAYNPDNPDREAFFRGDDEFRLFQ